MAVLQDNINDKNMPDHILVLNRIDIKNILNLPLKATQRIKVSYSYFNYYVFNLFKIIFCFSTLVLKCLRTLSFLGLPVVDCMYFVDNLVSLYNCFQIK